MQANTEYMYGSTHKKLNIRKRITIVLRLVTTVI